MEKVFASEMARFLLIIGMVLIGLILLLAGRITKLTGSFKPYRLATACYMIVGLLLFALAALAGYVDMLKGHVYQFVFLQVYFLFFGIFHLYCLHRYLKWSKEPETFWVECLFTVILALFGCMGYLFVFDRVNGNGLQYTMAGSIWCFLIPLFFLQTFRQAIDIPAKVLSEWFYPVDREMEEPEDAKMKNLLVISFEFQKQLRDSHLTNFRAKAPVDMDFGQLFYYFINDYNERHADNKIQFADAGGRAHGWIFYKRPRWYTLFTSYVDAEKTIFNNRIRENDVIICTRSAL